MPGSGSGHAEDLNDTVCFSEALEDDMWPRTDLLNLLGITHPIIQAPMSGFGGPALVAAVCNAGGLGSLGCATLSLM